MISFKGRKLLSLVLNSILNGPNWAYSIVILPTLIVILAIWGPSEGLSQQVFSVPQEEKTFQEERKT